MTSLRGPVRNVTLSRQVAERIQDMITSGAWPVGTRIPAEHDLVEQLGVSRNTVREALRSLVHARLLEARVGDGTYVRSTSVLESPLIERARAGGLDQTFELRAILEQHAARLAAQRRTDDDVARLRELLAAQQAAYAGGGTDAFAEADAALHREIVACAHNDLLAEVYQHLGAALADSISSTVWNDAIATEQQHNHHVLVEAIAGAHPDLAERAAAALVEASRASTAGPE